MGMDGGILCLTIFRIVQAIVAIIVLGTALFYVLKTSWRTDAGNFMVFNACWTLLVLCYLAVAPVWLSGRGHAGAVVFFEVVTLIFWFAGWIALAADLPDRHCIFGINCYSGRAINTGRTATAFGALEWALFMCTTAVVLYEVNKQRRRRGGGSRGAVGEETAMKTQGAGVGAAGAGTAGPHISSPQPANPSGTGVPGYTEPYSRI